jgi:hypothetical protein
MVEIGTSISIAAVSGSLDMTHYFQILFRGNKQNYKDIQVNFFITTNT